MDKKAVFDAKCLHRAMKVGVASSYLHCEHRDCKAERRQKYKMPKKKHTSGISFESTTL